MIAQPIYGSDRVGERSQTVVLTGTSSIEAEYKRLVGYKVYELKNHLGNVLATVSDRVTYTNGSTGMVGLRLADVKSASDYYPFGMIMPGKSSTLGEYRYGFNGKEMDNEVSGNGNSINFEFREYDPRISRFKSIDPWAAKYAYQSPYVFAHNSPIVLIEWMGLGDPPSSTKEEAVSYLNSQTIKDSDIWKNVPQKEFIDNVLQNINNPSRINQGEGTYFCGLAAGAGYVAEKDPLGYAKLMVSLYTKGEGKYGIRSLNQAMQ